MSNGGVAPGDDACRAWLRAAADGRVASALEAVYDAIGEEVRSRGPACWASGRCCAFERAGHRLYVTGLEAAYTFLRAGACGTPGVATPGRGVVTLAQVASAHAAGGCPYQDGHLCGAHAARPLGCRVYFCDRSAQAWQRELSERMLGAVRGLHDAHAVPYEYAEWRGLLARLAACALGAAPVDVRAPRSR